jgi:creatinine amidohydrolase/Fe(II)-dependent formamide hydrolase-like protein
VDVCGIESLTYREISRRIEKCPAIIVPLGGCEPFGERAAVGAETACARRVAEELGERCGVLVAPVIPFGCSTPFMAFAGSAGVKPGTFVNMLCEILHAYVFQGINRIFLVNAAMFNTEAVEEAAKRLGKKYPHVKIAAFDINTAAGRHNSDKYRTWKRRGKDPQKLRSLFLEGLLEPSDIEVSGECIDRMAESMHKLIQEEAGAI